MGLVNRAWASITQQGLSIRIAAAGLAVIALLAFLGPLTPWVDPYGTNTSALSAAPSLQHVLGTDGAGRDVLSRVLVGARTSLIVGCCSVVLLVVFATVLGATAGYLGGFVDVVLSRLIDAILSIPLLLLVTVFVAMLRPGTLTVILVIGMLGWPATARIVRAEVLALKQRPYIAAGQLAGLRGLGIVRHHLLPNLSPVLVVASTLGLGIAILMESTISFLGLGIKPPEASLGSIVSLALEPGVFRSAPWIWLPAAVVLAGLVVAVNLIGDALHAGLDPTSKEQLHA